MGPLHPSLHIDKTGALLRPSRLADQQVTEAGLWIAYPYSNPVTGKEGVNHVWVVRHDGVFIGFGWCE